MSGPLPGAPVVLTPAARAADDAWRDGRRERARGDTAAVDGWLAQAREATFGPLDAWLKHGRSA